MLLEDFEQKDEMDVMADDLIDSDSLKKSKSHMISAIRQKPVTLHATNKHNNFIENLESPLPQIKEDEQVSESMNSEKNKDSSIGLNSSISKKVINFFEEGSPMATMVEKINQKRENNSCTLILQEVRDKDNIIAEEKEWSEYEHSEPEKDE